MAVIDTRKLIGRIFTASTGNTAKLESLGVFGAARMKWHNRPTEEEMQEGVAWCEAQLNCRTIVTQAQGIEAEAIALKKWKQAIVGKEVKIDGSNNNT